jgi:fatty acid synthase, animal type
VTVGSAAKKAYLLERFPQLDEEDIGNSRSASFERMIMERTSGKGVDFVLNSLDKEKLQVCALVCMKEAICFSLIFPLSLYL